MNSQIPRQSNFELLRIISMFMIVFFHCVYHGNFDYSGTFNLTYWMLKEFWLLGELGVNLFMMLTGYFMVNGKFQFPKLIKIILQVYFYHILSCIIIWIIEMPNDTSLISLLTSLAFPVTRRVYWYITVYIMIYIFSPFINSLIKSLSQKDFAKLLIISFILWSAFPTALGWSIGVESDLHYYNRFIFFIFIYLLGAYMRLYSLSVINTKRASIILASISFLIASIAIPIIAYINSVLGLSIEPAYFWHPNTVITVFMSIGIFGIVKHINIPNKRWISILASTTTGIYMLHDGRLRFFLWQRLFPNALHQNSPWLIVYILFSVVIVFILGIIVDLIWQLITRNLLKKQQISSRYTWIYKKESNFISKIYHFFQIK